MQEKTSHNETFFIFERLRSVYQLKNNTALAKFLGVKPQSISTMVSRQSIPYEIIVSKCDKKHLPYILFGFEEKTSDFSQNSEKVEEPRSEYGNMTDPLCKHLMEENKFLKEEIRHKSKVIDKLHESLDLYRRGKVTINDKDS